MDAADTDHPDPAADELDGCGLDFLEGEQTPDDQLPAATGRVQGQTGG